VDASTLFEDSFSWLLANYATFNFVTERDIVWTLQKRIVETAKEHNLDVRTFSDYPILSGPRRGLSADLAILTPDGSSVEVAVEFKYEPAHSRKDIPHNKFPVCFWGMDGVAKDVLRIRQFVESGRVRRAYSYFIDEGSYFRHRPPHVGSEWEDRDVGHGMVISLLISRASAPELSS
jgi:hypothetical protein